MLQATRADPGFLKRGGGRGNGVQSEFEASKAKHKGIAFFVAKRGGRCAPTDVPLGRVCMPNTKLGCHRQVGMRLILPLFISKCNGTGSILALEPMR